MLDEPASDLELDVAYERTEYPRFAWSESRARRFQECRRKHYFAVYAAHNGWEPGATPRRRAAWTLAKLIPNWQAAVGAAAHGAAATILQGIARDGHLPTPAALRAQVAAHLNNVYRGSRDHVADFIQLPKCWPVLAPAFYGLPWQEDLATIRLSVAEVIDCLLGAEDLWRQARSIVHRAGPDAVAIPDPWYSFTLCTDDRASLLVYAAADVILIPPTEPVEIWDFKTGRADGVIDQVILYAVAARDGMGLTPARAEDERFLGRVVTLRRSHAAADAREPFAISEQDLAHCVIRVRDSARAMRELHPALGTDTRARPLKPFPRTERTWRCPHCVFRGICDGWELTNQSEPVARFLRAARVLV